MLRVCIFSENRKMEAGLRKIVQSYIYENLISVDIKVFRDIKMLLKSDISDAILFINDSEERSAVKTAQILREHDHNEKIVIITDSIDHVYDAFKVDAFRVIRMPVAKADIFEAINSFWKMKFSKKVILVKNGAQRITLSASDIIYVMSMNRDTVIVTKTENINTTVSLFQVAAQLPEETFFTCHRSYIINLMNIRTVTTGITSVRMSNGDEIPISRRRKTEFMNAREAYIDRNIYIIN